MSRVRMSLRASALSALALVAGVMAQVVSSSDLASSRRKRPFDEVPRAFQGRWAHVAADCRAGMSALHAAAILSIDAEGLKQGEAGFVVTRVLRTGDDPERIAIAVRDSRSGEKGESVEDLTLSKDGRILEWRRLAPQAGPAARLHRCR